MWDIITVELGQKGGNMKCAYHPDRDAVGACVNCGKPVCSECRTILGEKIYCGPCANQLFAPKPAAPAVTAARSGALTAGAVLSIIAGAIGVIAGLATIWIFGIGVIFLVPGAVAILGGAYALQKGTLDGPWQVPSAPWFLSGFLQYQQSYS